MERQCWSLQQRHIVFFLFSSFLSDDEKAAVAAALCGQPNEEIEPGKPEDPLLTPGKSLKDFVGPQSWHLFNIFGKLTSWLHDDPKLWASDPDFQAIQTLVDALLGVNDVAERGCRRAELYKVLHLFLYQVISYYSL